MAWKQVTGGGWKWIVGCLTVLVLLTGAAGLFLIGVDRFSFSLVIRGEDTLYLEYGDTYQEPGVEAILRGTCLWPEGVTVEASVDMDSTLDARHLGKYAITYTAWYLWWQAAAERTVWVIDTQKPVIELVGDGGAHIAGTPYEEEGFTARDNYDGDITHKVIRTEDMGLIRYTVLDSSGNQAYAQRQVPYHDPVPPEILLTGGEHYVHPAGTWYREPGFSAMDVGDGNVTDLVQVEGNVIWYRPGTYPITYRVADSRGNETIVTRQVEVRAAQRPKTEAPGDKTVYLTFDDGPGPYTRQLLDVLGRYGVKATFFVTNTDYVDILQEITHRGHSIGIHSVTHNYGTIYQRPDAYFRDLYAMQDIIYEHTGIKTTLLRFPGGSSNTVSCYNPGIMSLLTRAVEDAGFQYFDWNVDSNDAGGAKHTSTVRSNVIEGIRNHPCAVVLQHDIHAFSVAAVEEILIWGIDNGYQFQPLTQTSPPVHHGVNN